MQFCFGRHCCTTAFVVHLHFVRVSAARWSPLCLFISSLCYNREDLKVHTDGRFVEDMNLSNIVHTGHQHPHKHHSSNFKQIARNQQHYSPNGHRQDMAPALVERHRSSQSLVYTRPPKPPPSPPAEEDVNFRSLPSIQSLIKMNHSNSGHGTEGKRSELFAEQIARHMASKLTRPMQSPRSSRLSKIIQQVKINSRIIECIYTASQP